MNACLQLELDYTAADNDAAFAAATNAAAYAAADAAADAYKAALARINKEDPQ